MAMDKIRMGVNSMADPAAARIVVMYSRAPKTLWRCSCAALLSAYSIGLRRSTRWPGPQTWGIAPIRRPQRVGDGS